LKCLQSCALAPRKDGKGPKEFLLQEANATGWDGARSMAFSKRFATYRRRCGVNDLGEGEGRRRSRVNFHWFRGWFITIADQAGIAARILSAWWVTRPGMSLGRYSAGSTLGQLQEDAQRPKLNRREEGQFKASSIATDRSFARRREEGDKPMRLTYSGPKGRGLVLWSSPCIK
jgi:hypothetical protein